MAKDRFLWIDVLRGLAALAVTWAHVVRNNPPIMQNPAIDAILQGSAAYGFLGVYAFYAVSGFVIPLAMVRTGYTHGMFGRFMQKRLLRLQPPYYVSIVLAVAVAYAATRVPSYQGIPFDVAPANWLLHIVYLPSVFGYDWVNPVYWSLLVEVEYYLAIGLVMPFLLRATPNGLAAMLCAACLLPFAISSFMHLPFHLPFFVIGAALCFRFTDRLDAARTIGVIAFAFAMIGIQRDVEYLGAAAFVLPFFLLKVSPPTILRRMGDISYSLYLVHYPIGLRAVRFLTRYTHNDMERLGAYAVALALCLMAAIVLYHFVEKPSLTWSARIRLKRRDADVRGDMLATAPAP